MLETVVRALGKSDLFATLEPPQLRKVAARAELLQAAADEVVLREGDPSEAFYLVLSGEASVRGQRDGEVGRLGPADVVGEMGVLLGEPRTATVVADGPMVLLRFDAPVFDAMFERIPGFGMAVGRALARRLAAATRQLPP
jgi:CRP-like cAMP-binding protein